MDFRIVQKPFASLVHLLIYFSHPVKLENDQTFGNVWIVKPKSLKFPKGKFEPKPGKVSPGNKKTLIRYVEGFFCSPARNRT